MTRTKTSFMLNKPGYRVIGVMSGTSLDGLDVACCAFRPLKSGWKYTIQHATTLKYPTGWLKRLSVAHTLQGEDLMALDADYGTYIGKAVRLFMNERRLKVDFVASHGHTVFHQPSKRFTTQIGNGYSLHVASELPVICDFRMYDVALGGEGAPLVPVGDRVLFHEYDVCLNLGGIANLSMDVRGRRIAYDICFCNMGLNLLAGEASKKFDKNGAIAAAGTINEPMLIALNKAYGKYRLKRPSLGREIFERDFAGLLADKSIPLEDRLCTFAESVAIQICSAIPAGRRPHVLCTGGGAFNSYLISRMLEHGGDDITFIIPDDDVVSYKEALVFAFLGVLRVRNEANCIKSVTNAKRDSSSGTMIGF